MFIDIFTIVNAVASIFNDESQSSDSSCNVCTVDSDWAMCDCTYASTSSKSLSRIDCSNRGLKDVPVWPSACSTNDLRLIDFSGNHINTVRSTSFAGFRCPSKKPAHQLTLDLSSNSIQFFEYISILTCAGELNLNDNHLTSLSLTWNKMSQLTTVNLANNKFRKIPNSICSAKQLNQLQIYGNPFRSQNELSGLKNCVALLRVETSYDTITCSCENVANAKNKTIPLKYVAYTVFATRKENTVCDSRSSLPESAGMDVEKIPSDVISQFCQSFSAQKQQHHVPLAILLCFLLKHIFNISV